MTTKEIEFRYELENALESDNRSECKLKFALDNPVFDGFVADVYFAELSSISTDNTKKTQKIFLKCGKDVDTIKEAVHFVPAYERESFFYSVLYPAFSVFLAVKNVSFDGIPNCLTSLMIGNRSVIVLEDLRSQGYKMNDVHIPMTFDHMKLVFQAYAIFHSISLTFKDQRPEEFKMLTSNLNSLFVEKFILDGVFRKKYENHDNKMFAMLDDMGETTILKRWKKVLKRGSMDILKETCEYKIKETVVAHLDCWNNNMMFKYQVGTIDVF